MKKILVANRGEIAVRVMRTAKEMNIKTVAVFSEADRLAPHVRYADEAVFIGPSPSNQSYLVGEKIIEAAKSTKATGIHPGYGFLSENPDFARKVEMAGIKFIGPSAQSMKIMGNKLTAKATVAKYDVPMVPGTDKAITNTKSAKKSAKEIKFPILIKAAAGGGGKGMRVVKKEKDFDEQMKLAASEAKSAFGDGSVFIERYVSSPRHIEIQILADTHGNIVHLFERESSIQRRHQKVIEEAPSCILSEELRTKMGECAVNVAKSCKYVGAGTVEFLLDSKKKFYFLEMNTRLQVEHPVTEQITGIDIVKEQINIARGKKLSFSQEDIKMNGHSIEIRIYAEDPANNFLPDIGILQTYQPAQGSGVRVDDGYTQGMEIPIYYDPMLAKLISYGKNRNEAIKKMSRAIDEYLITGVETTLPFCKFVINHPNFQSGKFDTHFIEKHFTASDLESGKKDEEMIAALFAGALHSKKRSTKKVLSSNHVISKWRTNRVEK